MDFSQFWMTLEKQRMEITYKAVITLKEIAILENY
jgi:hypothetical protein